MEIIIAIIAFIFIFSTLIIIHELGHFFMARRANIKVEEFGFGLPPRIWGVKKGETLYSLNAIPFGGFVRLYGEDSRDAKLLKNKRSFIAQKPRVRIGVVVAGVFMNFLLSFFLLTLGFIMGIKPLMINGDDVLNFIDSGHVHIEQGVKIKKIELNSVASLLGLKAGDVLLNLDSKSFPSPEIFKKQWTGKTERSFVVDFLRGKERHQLILNNKNHESLGIIFYDTIPLPRVMIQEVKPDSSFALAGIQKNDIVLSINKKNVYLPEEVELALESFSTLEFKILRGHQILDFVVQRPFVPHVVISNVTEDSPAFKAGFEKGDVIVRINNLSVLMPQDVLDRSKNFPGKTLVYTVMRGNAVSDIAVIADKDGRIGVWLTRISSYQDHELSYYPTDVLMSVTAIDDVVYPFWEAPVKAVEELWRLSILTVQMFGNLAHSLVTQFVVPEGVSGPVGIAQMTSVFAQEGIMSLLRFMALLSLSLAIINVLPFPALDGGRLFFIVVEIIVGKRMNQRIETVIHAVGFVLLILLIFLVTSSDIARLF